MERYVRFLVCLLVLVSAAAAAQKPVDIKPAVVTEAVVHDADDPAVWVNRRDPGQSLIIGTDKGDGGTGGGLYVFGLDGKIRQKILDVKRPNNVDVEYGFQLGKRSIDIAVMTDSGSRQLRIYEISPTGKLTDVSGKSQAQDTPWGIALYKRPSDGAIYAVVGRPSGPKENYLTQYLLKDNGSGKVDVIEVRKFGRFSGTDLIEAVAVDDALGYVYYADESTCIRKYHADPDHPSAGKELGTFGVGEYAADREGIAVYTIADGTGYVVCTDQLKNSRYLVYPREGLPGKPHEHGKAIKIVQGGARGTDGIEVVSASLGPKFPNGILVAMNSPGRNFFIYDWRTVAGTGKPALKTSKNAN